MKLSKKDIDLIATLLRRECDHHVYCNFRENVKHKEVNLHFKERYYHMQDLIIKLTKHER